MQKPVTWKVDRGLSAQKCTSHKRCFILTFNLFILFLSVFIFFLFFSVSFSVCVYVLCMYVCVYAHMYVCVCVFGYVLLVYGWHGRSCGSWLLPFTMHSLGFNLRTLG